MSSESGSFPNSLSCALLGSLGEIVVGVRDPQHDRLGRSTFHGLSKRSHFLTSLPPMIWIIGQQAWRGGIGRRGATEFVDDSLRGL
jgi:hypothetical protein